MNGLFDKMNNFLKIYLTTQGRLNRLRYFKYGLILGISTFIVSVILQVVATLITGSEDGFVVQAIAVSISVIWFLGYITLVIRRLHDLDKKDIWAIGALIPYVNFAFGIYLLLMPGTPGRNQFGADPLLE